MSARRLCHTQKAPFQESSHSALCVGYRLQKGSSSWGPLPLSVRGNAALLLQVCCDDGGFVKATYTSKVYSSVLRWLPKSVSTTLILPNKGKCSSLSSWAWDAVVKSFSTDLSASSFCLSLSRRVFKYIFIYFTKLVLWQNYLKWQQWPVKF